MQPRSWFALATALAFGSCGGDPDTATAARTFADFQAALQRGDAAACRELLTNASAGALEAMPWDRVRQQQPLAVLGAERGQGDFRVHVQDPNDGGRRSQFVVVREYGRFVVDLVATAGLHTEVVEAAGSREALVPRAFTPADEERIRQFELGEARR